MATTNLSGNQSNPISGKGGEGVLPGNWKFEMEVPGGGGWNGGF